jgi:CRP-like cAMP-binding protein
MTNPLILKLEQRDQLSVEERRILEGTTSRIKEFRPNEDIVREGETMEFSCLLLEGWTSRNKTLANGRHAITALHVMGDFVDLHSLLLRPMDQTVTAITPCRMALVPHESLREITRHHPHLARMLWLSTLIDAAIHRQWLFAMGQLSSAGQLAHLICELYLRLQSVGQARDLSFTFPITQVLLADVLGISPVHVNRTVQELRRENLITWTGMLIRIEDWDRLSRSADFDPAYLNLSKVPR